MLLFRPEIYYFNLKKQKNERDYSVSLRCSIFHWVYPDDWGGNCFLFFIIKKTGAFMTLWEIGAVIVGGYTLALLFWIGTLKLFDCFCSQLDT